MRTSLHLRSKQRQQGVALIEISVGLGALLIVALLMMKQSLNVATNDRWTVVQSLTDAFMTQEVALAKRYPFEEFKGLATLWPTFPQKSTETVTIGKLPGGIPVTATLYRTKRPDPNNLPTGGGTGTATTNPASMESWVLQSYVNYKIGQRQYLKSRSVVRSR